MIKLKDIQKHICKLLYSKYKDYDIITEEQVADVESPTFFIDVRPITTSNYMRYKYKTVNIDICYVDKEDIHQNNLDIVDNLQEIFEVQELRVNETHLVIENLSFSEPSFLICSFTLKYFDKNTNVLPEDRHSDKMETLHERDN